MIRLHRIVTCLVLLAASDALAQPAPPPAPPTPTTAPPAPAPPAAPPAAPSPDAAAPPDATASPDHVDVTTDNQPPETAGEAKEPLNDEYEREPTHKKKPKYGAIVMQPGRGLQFVSAKGKSKVRLVLTVQPMVRLAYDNKLPDIGINMELRRARFGFEAKVDKHVGLKWELQIKNNKLGLSNLYGIYRFNDHLKLKAGFIKAPGGLERDTYSFNEPFIERSVVAFTTFDHEMGAKIEGHTESAPLFYAFSLTRNAPIGIDGGDPEDQPVVPPGVDPDDINNAPSHWNTAGRIGTAPSDEFEASFSYGLRFRPSDEPEVIGDRLAEPFDTAILDARPYAGTNFHVQADAAVAERHFRVMMEGGFRRDGRELSYDPTTGAKTVLDGNMTAALGYLTFGWTPNGHYGPAVDNAPLLDGVEIITRVEAARAKPAETGAATFASITSGVHMEVTRSLRVQADFALQKYNENAITRRNDNHDATRVYAELWATWRL